MIFEGKRTGKRRRNGFFGPRAARLPVCCLLTALLLSACGNSFGGSGATSVPTKPPKEQTRTASAGAESEPTPEATAEPTPEPSAFVLSELPKTEVNCTNRDVFPENSLDPTRKHSILVIYLSFTDGYAFDEALLADAFCGEYSREDCLRSVSSYYRYNTYGLDLLDFRLYSYDTGMTSEEAYHYVNDPDENGNIVGNDLLYDAFGAVKAEDPDGIAAMDPDGDGWIDAAIFVTGEPLMELEIDGRQGHYLVYGGASGSTNEWEHPPVPGNPVFRQYVKMPFYDMTQPIEQSDGYTRTLIHEVGHLFGISDYYDWYWYEDRILSTLGTFDMHASQYGDLNPFSRLSCGWLRPYVITEDVESVTFRLKSSSLTDDAILIPTSKGWNGSPFDEYVLVDVLSPDGANAFDWSYLEEQESRYSDAKKPTQQGGVRVYHVDARLQRLDENGYSRVEDPAAAAGGDGELRYAYYNTNGVDPHLETDSRFWHLLEIVPADGSSKFRLNETPPSWAIYDLFRPNDLFAPGECFSMEACAASFAEAPRMNNGGTLDYAVKVESYDPDTSEAIVTVFRVN